MIRVFHIRDRGSNPRIGVSFVDTLFFWCCSVVASWCFIWVKLNKVLTKRKRCEVKCTIWVAADGKNSFLDWYDCNLRVSNRRPIAIGHVYLRDAVNLTCIQLKREYILTYLGK